MTADVPLVCDKHDTMMVHDFRFMGWRCPMGGAWIDDEEYYRLASALRPRTNATGIRVVGCRDNKKEERERHDS